MDVTEHSEPLYAYIGQRIRDRRKLLKLNQTELAELMGFSYQQMQKYETGASRVSAGKLLLFAKILNVPPGYFYEGLRLEEDIGARIDGHVIQKIRTRPLRILLVEDNPADVILFRKTLQTRPEKLDIQVMHDAEKALEFLQNHDAKFSRDLPDLIILDLALPKCSGKELLKAIKKNPKMMELPVVVLTHSINVKDMMESYRFGAAGFIQQPVDMKEYTETLGVLIEYWAKTVALPC